MALAYSPDSRWRNRSEFLTGREEIITFLTRKWKRERDYRLIKEVCAFHGDRIAVRFAYEYHDEAGNWFRAYPSSSRMFATLIPLLADRYHLVAPDYPGFGESDAPSASQFHYTFDRLAEIVSDFTQQLGLRSYVLYQQDYGGPIGMRLAVAHPERVKAIIVQNAVTHDDGLGPAWDIRKAFWKDRAAYEDKVIPGFTSLEGARMRHLGSSPHPDRYDPELWDWEAAHLAQPGQRQIQSDLFFDYQTNVANYPFWQAWLKRNRPRLFVLWGRYDPSFALSEADAYKRDVPDAEVHILDAGHFALDEKVDEAATLIRAFLGRQPL